MLDRPAGGHQLERYDKEFIRCLGLADQTDHRLKGLNDAIFIEGLLDGQGGLTELCLIKHGIILGVFYLPRGLSALRRVRLRAFGLHLAGCVLDHAWRRSCRYGRGGNRGAIRFDLRVRDGWRYGRWRTLLYHATEACVVYMIRISR